MTLNSRNGDSCSNNNMQIIAKIFRWNFIWRKSEFIFFQTWDSDSLEMGWWGQERNVRSDLSSIVSFISTEEFHFPTHNFWSFFIKHYKFSSEYSNDTYFHQLIKRPWQLEPKNQECFLWECPLSSWLVPD